MFKGIKKRFSTNRSGRNRRLVSGGREPGETSPREPPDKGGSKPTSPRQVHPVDQISPIPYARRSLERRSRTVPSGKHSPASVPGGYDRRTESFCLSPTTHAYPTTPNICVTGGKIEFITPPGSTLSSIASGNCCTLLSSPSPSPVSSPKRESPLSLRNTLPVNKAQMESPSRKPSRKMRSPGIPVPSSETSRKTSTSSATSSAIKKNNNRKASPKHEDLVNRISKTESSLELRENQQLDNIRVKRSSTMPERESADDELETLRKENMQVKLQLATLQQEFMQLSKTTRKQDSKSCEKLNLQEYVEDLKESNRIISSQGLQDKDKEEKLSQYQLLVERCNNLEIANSQLHSDSQVQRQQYEKCLDQVASQVVQAILVQKTQQEQCERLSKKVENLQKQNVTLYSFIAAKGRFQSLNLPQHRRGVHSLPTSCSSSPANSQSLPSTLTKLKVVECETSKESETNSSSSWYNKQDNSSKSTSTETNKTNLFRENPVLPSYSSSSLPQSSTASIRSALRHQSSADACWYDIIKSLQQGENATLNGTHNMGDHHNLSSDSSSVDTEEQSMDSQRRILPEIEDNSSTSSGGDDFHPVSLSTSFSQRQQGDITFIPSNTASNLESLNSTDHSIGTSSHCSQVSKLSPTKGRSSDVSSLDLLTQSSIHQNLVVNFSLTNCSPESSDKSKLPSICKVSCSCLSTIPCIDNQTLSVCKNQLGSPSKTTLSQTTKKVQINGVPENKSSVNIGENNIASEGITKDEGYSTMSSDVQSEVKENPNVCKITTVEEEKGKSLDYEYEAKDGIQTGTVKQVSVSSNPSEVEKSNNKKNLSLNTNTLSDTISGSDEHQPEYCDGLRVVYDEEDSNSDVFFIPISDDRDKSLRHSCFNFPFPEEQLHLQRCFSDSYLYKLFVRYPNCTSQKSIKFCTNQNTIPLQSLPLNKQNQHSSYNTYLRRAFRRESLKRGCLKLFNKPLAQSSIKNELGKNVANSLNYDFLSQVFHPSISHPRILSPSYSHAEMEDWSLDLSGEDITTPGGTEPSAAESVSAPSHHQSQPSIQEANLDLEEDHHDFLWNGATYFKADDNELLWPYDKDQNKDWDLNLVGNKQSGSMISPKSGCSDQPAIWSSSEQLSCCSDLASKCSTDIENFCDQLCNLPELKRVSFCSSDNGGPESIPSNPKLSEIDSNEDNSEIVEDIGVDTVFTRDFYRLVKFESTRSLAASSKSLANSEGFLTMERLQGLESLQNNKTLASVLGFIAEQQKYCKDREVMDENADYIPSNGKEFASNKGKNTGASVMINELDSAEDASVHFFNNNFENMIKSGNGAESENILTSSESLSCLDLDAECKILGSSGKMSPKAPPKPKRSTSLNLGVKCGSSHRGRRTLPTQSAFYSPPPLPSRSTSRATLPHQHVLRFSHPHNPPEIEEESFPSPPEDPYVEPYHSISVEPPPPIVPPHKTPIPSIPQRSSSVSQIYRYPNTYFSGSPPIPKRITSRALPTPPPVCIPPRTYSLENPKTQPLKSIRPRSLLKEATVSNAFNRSHNKQRGSCGDLAPLCRNSATLMLELQKMAKAEEDEKGSGFYSPEATSPSTEVGLGTGWVRVEPISDLGDPQTRANLLDTMLQSSEGCSSETDEDLAKHLQHTELLKAVQRNRRKRKALRHSGSDPMRVIGWNNHPARPTILGRHSLFTRFGEEEEKALREFQFLDCFSSQSDVRSPDPCRNISPYVFIDDGVEETRTNHPQKFLPPSGYHLSSYLRSIQPRTDLKDLRSSEPCHDINEYPISSYSTTFESMTPVSHPSLPSSSLHILKEDLSEEKTHCKYPSFCSQYSSKLIQGDSLISRLNNKLNSVEEPNQHRNRAFDNKVSTKLPPEVPLHRPCNRSHDPYINGGSITSKIRQSELNKPSIIVDSNDSENLSKSVKSKIPTKNEIENHDNVNTKSSFHRDSSEERELIDTRSLCNVKAAIQKLNDKNPPSGNLKSNSGICSKRNSLTEGKIVNSQSSRSFSSGNSKKNVQKDQDKVDNSVNSKKNNLYSTELCQDYAKPSTQLPSKKLSGQARSCSNPSTNSKRTPKLPGTNLIKRLAANSPTTTGESVSLSSKGNDASLPPKVSPSRLKERPNNPSRLPRIGGMVRGGMAKTPRLQQARIGKDKAKTSDPLEVFNGKSLCDSGSSEGSEKAFGRLSISDSCAEIFSHGESGDEVFQKIC